MSTGLKANSDGSAAIQVGGTDVITLTSGGAATFVTSPTTVQAGTAAAPSITFSGRTNTGIYSPAANTLAFSTSGAEVGRFDSAGRMLVGTTTAPSSSDVKVFVNSSGGGFAGFAANGTAGGAIGCPTTSTLTLYTAAGTLGAETYTERARIDSSGRLLIGNTSNFSSGPVQAWVNGTGTSFQTNPAVFGAISTVVGREIPMIYGSDGINSGLISSLSGNMAFFTQATERARFTSAGEFLIGTTTSGGYQMAVSGATTNGVTGIKLINTATTSSSGNVNMFVAGSAYGSFGVAANSGWLCVEGANNLAVGPTGAGNVTFVANGSERARFTSGGGFTCAGIYSTTVGATNRDVFVDNGGVVGYVASIRASKTNIQNLTDTSWLHQLNPVSFNYRKKDEEGNYTDEIDGGIQYGMIAEDVEQVRPDLCFYDEVDGQQELRGIQYSKLVPVMLKALQQQQAMIDELKAKVAALEGA